MDPVVTVFCITYNQADYICDCLEGIVSQKTNFAFTAIVHDDASTDGTAEIVRKYAEKYPGTIIPVIETENQFSKGFNVSNSWVNSIKWGKYIACCEGDDYWMDSCKLQKQYDFMEAHPDYSLCLHNAIINDFRYKIDYLSEPNSADKDKSCEEIIFEGGGKLNPTSSFFIRADCEWPSIPHNCSANDHFELIKLASRGKVYWFSEPMSVYRWGVKGSWTDRQKHINLEQAQKHVESRIEALDIYDEATKGNYHDSFKKRAELESSKLEVAKQIEQLNRAGSMIKAFLLNGVFAREKIKFGLRKILPAKVSFLLWRKKKIMEKKKTKCLVCCSNQAYSIQESML